jgi:hypothetical protein
MPTNATENQSRIDAIVALSRYANDPISLGSQEQALKP